MKNSYEKLAEHLELNLFKHTGLCSNITVHFDVSKTVKKKALKMAKDIAKEQLVHSGDDTFFIKNTVRNCAKAAYFTDRLYDPNTEYGRARLRVLDTLITRLYVKSQKHEELKYNAIMGTAIAAVIGLALYLYY